MPDTSINLYGRVQAYLASIGLADVPTGPLTFELRDERPEGLSSPYISLWNKTALGPQPDLTQLMVVYSDEVADKAAKVNSLPPQLQALVEGLASAVHQRFLLGSGKSDTMPADQWGQLVTDEVMKRL